MTDPQQPKGSRRWMDVGPAIQTFSQRLLAFALVVFGLWTAWEFYFSEPEVTHGDLDTVNPLSIPFEISNPHYFPIAILEAKCIVDLNYPTHRELNSQLSRAREAPTILWHKQGIAYRCPVYPREGFTDVAIRISIYYAIFSPRLWDMRATSDFRLIRGADGTPRWGQWLDQEQRGHDFIEHPAPKAVGTAYVHCDVVQAVLPGSETLLCSFIATRDGRVLSLNVERLDQMTTHIKLVVEDKTGTDP